MKHKRNILTDKSGAVWIYIVLIATLFSVAFFGFLLSSGVQQFQEQINPELNESKWVSSSHFDAFVLAATFVNNLWILFPVILILGLAYWAYTEAQRRTD